MALHVEKTLKITIQKTYQNLRNLKGKYLWRSFVVVKKFFAVHSNFSYDSKTYDLIKLCFETSLEILVSPLLFMDRVSQTLYC